METHVFLWAPSHQEETRVMGIVETPQTISTPVVAVHWQFQRNTDAIGENRSSTKKGGTDGPI